MPRVSKIKLDKELEDAMFDQFWSSLCRINDASQASEFFSDLLTKSEEIMLTKRFAAAILIIRGKTATEIRNSIHLSYTSIGSVSSWVKDAKPKTKEILKSFSKEKNWERIIDKIDELLDKLPMKYGTDWSQTSKNKLQRNYNRSARSSLR